MTESHDLPSDLADTDEMDTALAPATAEELQAIEQFCVENPTFMALYTQFQADARLAIASITVVDSDRQRVLGETDEPDVDTLLRVIRMDDAARANLVRDVARGYAAVRDENIQRVEEI